MQNNKTSARQTNKYDCTQIEWIFKIYRIKFCLIYICANPFNPGNLRSILLSQMPRSGTTVIIGQ